MKRNQKPVPVIFDKNIPELYQKAMLWKDWKEASKGQRR